MDYQDEYNQMMKESSKNQQMFRYLVITVVAFVVGFGAAWLSFKSQGEKVAVVENENRNSKFLQGRDLAFFFPAAIDLNCIQFWINTVDKN